MQIHDFSNILFPKSISVTDQEIDISSLTEEQKKFYVDLFKEVVLLYQAKQKPRTVVGVAGPAGSGKSAMMAIFHTLAKQVSLPFRFETIGIDAFHFTNEYLLANMSNGEPLKKHKGRYNTYDVDKLSRTLKQFSLGGEVSFPVYSRKTHDPVENAVTLGDGIPALLIVEGLWVLYDKGGWEEVGDFLDYSYFITVDEKRVRQGVLDRHVRGGRSPDDAAQYYEENEAKNFTLVEQTKNRANKIIPSYYETS